MNNEVYTLEGLYKSLERVRGTLGHLSNYGTVVEHGELLKQLTAKLAECGEVVDDIDTVSNATDRGGNSGVITYSELTPEHRDGNNWMGVTAEDLAEVARERKAKGLPTPAWIVEADKSLVPSNNRLKQG